MPAHFRISRLVIASASPTLVLALTALGCSVPAPGDGAGGSGGGGTATGGTTNPGAGGSSTGGGSTNTGGANGGSTSGTGGSTSGTGGSNFGSGGAVAGGTSGGGGDGGSSGGQTGTGSTGSTGGSPGTGGGSSGLDDYNEDFKEFVGEDCDLPEPMLLSSPDHSLPDPFLMADGSRMSSLSQWACQRAWLKKNLAAFVHGEKPGKPDTVTGSVSSTGVNIHVEHGGSSADFSIPIDLPPGSNGAVPAMFQADGSGVPTGFLHDEGVAAMAYSHSEAEGAFNSIYGGSGVASPIKWAWAVSRAIDVLVTERDAGNNDIIDPTGLGTTGCSYAGKSAFVVGAYDERIALGLPVESGTGGLASYRVVGDMDLGPNGGEDPEQIGEACGQDWLTSEVCDGNVDAVPADSHFLVAMYAPRGFTTLDNNRIGHLAPVAQFTAAAAGAEVFKAFGIESHVGYHGGNDTDPHNHCSFNQSQEEPARKAIQGFLTKSAEPANSMEPKLKDSNDQEVDFNLEDYIDWDTPTLD